MNEIPTAAEQLARWTAADLGWERQWRGRTVRRVNHAAESGSITELRQALAALERHRDVFHRENAIRLRRALDGDPHSLRDAALGHQTHCLLRTMRARLAGHDVLELHDLRNQRALTFVAVKAPAGGGYVVQLQETTLGSWQRPGRQDVLEHRQIEAESAFAATATYLTRADAPLHSQSRNDLTTQLARINWIEQERHDGQLDARWLPEPYLGEAHEAANLLRPAPKQPRTDAEAIRSRASRIAPTAPSPSAGSSPPSCATRSRESAGRAALPDPTDADRLHRHQLEAQRAAAVNRPTRGRPAPGR